MEWLSWKGGGCNERYCRDEIVKQVVLLIVNSALEQVKTPIRYRHAVCTLDTWTNPCRVLVDIFRGRDTITATRCHHSCIACNTTSVYLLCARQPPALSHNNTNRHDPKPRLTRAKPMLPRVTWHPCASIYLSLYVCLFWRNKRRQCR